MPRPRMRPSFYVEAVCDPEIFVASIRARLDSEPRYIEGDVARRQCTLRVPETGRNLSTPCLDLMIDEGQGSADGPSGSNPCFM